MDENPVDDELRQRALSGFRPADADAVQPPLHDVRRRVEISEVRIDQANALVHRPVALMGALLPRVDAYDYGQLTRATTRLVLLGQCRDGLDLDALSREAHVGRGRLGDRFGPLWQLAGGMVVRAALAQSARSVFYEEISSLPSRVRRRDNGLGTDKHPGVASSRHVIVHSLGCGERLVPTAAMPFTTGTRDDRTSERADMARIDEWAEQLGGSVPGSAAEHVERLLARDEEVRALARHALRLRPDLVGGDGVPVEALARAFSCYLLVPGLPCGAPRASHRASDRTILPGLDQAVVEVVRAHKRSGVLYCGELQRSTLPSDFVALTPGPLPCAFELGISSPYGVVYQWSRRRCMIARQLVGRGVRTELWRLVNFTESRLLAALSLIERHDSGWTDDCLERWEADCGPGLLKARNATMTLGALDLLNVANAMIVEAHRRGQQ